MVGVISIALNRRAIIIRLVSFPCRARLVLCYILIKMREYMELGTFIKETLIQISNGVKEANDDLAPSRKKEDGTELPRLFLLSPGKSQEQGNGIHFDVAVTTQNINEGQGGAKLKLVVLEAELGGKLMSSIEAVSRIQFSINVNQWHG